MELSKSRYCEAVQCKKMLWLDDNKSEEKQEVSNDSVLDNGTEVGELAKNLFGKYVNISFNTDLNKMVIETKEALKKENTIITEASFKYLNNFCSVDILKKIGNDIYVYEVKSSTEIKDIYLDDISYQIYILLGLGYNVKKANIVYINSQYIRNGDLDLNQLFNIRDVTDIVLSKQNEVKKKVKEINEYMMQKTEQEEKIGMQCVTPYDCPFFKYCTKHLPDRNIFKLRGIRKSTQFKLYNDGIYTYEDLLKIKLNQKYKQQIEFELYNLDDYIDKEKIREFLNTLTYPLYFLDFETYQQSIPKYDGISPYMQVPFQYSLHYVLEENGELYHKEFLAEAGIDPRRKLALQLVNDIPLDVCTVAYNMKFEKMVIKNLACLYPDLRDHLMNIHDHMQDLMIPFKNRDYYSKNMDGSFSIKYVLPALFPNDPSLDYHNLDGVHNGSEAMNTYTNLEEKTLQEQEIIRNQLLKYCELDTYAMVKIWEKLKEVVQIKRLIK